MIPEFQMAINGMFIALVLFAYVIGEKYINPPVKKIVEKMFRVRRKNVKGKMQL